ncbi:hypothetical protein SDC9_151346 [bioreactor metagenome]|uniref:Uncharacterized protein n=1 Tax=bioreactor metagenome TaxID=1076179 RepID=A0A645ERT5_9ZZZZ
MNLFCIGIQRLLSCLEFIIVLPDGIGILRFNVCRKAIHEIINKLFPSIFVLPGLKNHGIIFQTDLLNP